LSEMEALSKLKDEFEEKLLALKGVVGVSVGFKVKDGKKTGILSIRVLVKKKRGKLWMKLFSPEAMVPESVEGFPTDVVEVGVIQALQKRTDKWRPAPGGVSIGHKAITAGTLGGLVKDRATGKIMVLSNNHVLANSDMTTTEKAHKGDPILQPGPYDGGKDPADRIAKLERWIQIDPFKANEVDCAVATPLNEADVSVDILEIGSIAGVGEPELGMKVQKSGRTTGITTGEITDLHATIRVQYPGGYIITFKDQVLTTPMLEGGDSGSKILDMQKILRILGFAGSDQVSCHNKISKVLEALKVDPVVSEAPPVPKPRVKIIMKITVDGTTYVETHEGREIKLEEQIVPVET